MRTLKGLVSVLSLAAGIGLSSSWLDPMTEGVGEKVGGNLA